MGRLGRDVIFYCEEIWDFNKDLMIVDVSGMLDGILWFLVILIVMLI